MSKVKIEYKPQDELEIKMAGLSSYKYTDQDRKIMDQRDPMHSMLHLKPVSDFLIRNGIEAKYKGINNSGWRNNPQPHSGEFQFITKKPIPLKLIADNFLFPEYIRIKTDEGYENSDIGIYCDKTWTSIFSSATQKREDQYFDQQHEEYLKSQPHQVVPFKKNI